MRTQPNAIDRLMNEWVFVGGYYLTRGEILQIQLKNGADQKRAQFYVFACLRQVEYNGPSQASELEAMLHQPGRFEPERYQKRTSTCPTVEEFLSGYVTLEYTNLITKRPLFARYDCDAFGGPYIRITSEHNRTLRLREATPLEAENFLCGVLQMQARQSIQKPTTAQLSIFA